MQNIKFACPHCQQHLEAPLDMAGDVIDCPQCTKTITVPQHMKQDFPKTETTQPQTTPSSNAPSALPTHPKSRKALFIGLAAAAVIAVFASLIVCWKWKIRTQSDSIQKGPFTLTVKDCLSGDETFCFLLPKSEKTDAFLQIFSDNVEAINQGGDNSEKLWHSGEKLAATKEDGSQILKAIQASPHLKNMWEKNLDLLLQASSQLSKFSLEVGAFAQDNVATTVGTKMGVWNENSGVYLFDKIPRGDYYVYSMPRKKPKQCNWVFWYMLLKINDSQQLNLTLEKAMVVKKPNVLAGVE